MLTQGHGQLWEEKTSQRHMPTCHRGSQPYEEEMIHRQIGLSGFCEGGWIYQVMKAAATKALYCQTPLLILCSQIRLLVSMWLFYAASFTKKMN